MRKKTRLQIVSLAVCFCFLFIAVPGLNSAEKKMPKTDSKFSLKKPVLLLSMFFPIFSSIYDTGSSTPTKNENSSGKIKSLGGSLSGRPSTGD